MPKAGDEGERVLAVVRRKPNDEKGREKAVSIREYAKIFPLGHGREKLCRKEIAGQASRNDSAADSVYEKGASERF